MSRSVNVQEYLRYLDTPWGQLFYRMIGNHLPFENQNILDYGSGFGVTADRLAAHNEVTAVEPNEEILAHRFRTQTYTQLVGGTEQLAALPDGSFDVIVCHNVMEYMEQRRPLLGEFRRLIKPDGCLSVVKHNRAGKIMQKAVFEYAPEEAMDLLRGANGVSVSFGEVREYDLDELEQDCANQFAVNHICGVRMFYGLQRNDWKTQADWQDRMFALESAAEEIPAFRDIAFFHHVMLQPI